MFREQLALFLERYEREIEESARELLGREMPALTEELFCLFETTGNRLKYEEVYFERRKMLAVLGMRFVLGRESEWEDRQVYLRKLEEVVKEICREECWALPAHVDRAGDPGWRVTVDLFAAETGQTLSEILAWTEGDLSPWIAEAVRENIERRIFQPFFTSAVPYARWEGCEDNWNAVCAGSIASACLHLMKEEPEQLRSCLKRLTDSLVCYIRGFAADGACMEGIGYYYYGMTYFVNFAQELYEATGGKTDLFRGRWGDFEGETGDRRDRIACFPVKCFFPDGKSLSFSDGNAEGCFRAGVNSILAIHYAMPGREKVGWPAAMFPDMSRAAGLHSDSCYRFAALKMDLTGTRRLLELWQDSGLEECMEEGKPETYILPEAQWYIAHSGAGVSFACKGGHNGEPHNHNDIGHFIYEGRGELFLTDLGAGEYTRDYFGEKRYEILCNHSFGHSVPVINGQGQESGEKHSCSEFSADAGGHVSMELHGAYPEGMLETFRRDFDFDRESGRLQVRDRIVFADAEDNRQRVRESLITQIKPEIQGNRVFLKTGKGTCILTVDQIGQQIEIREYSHSNHRGEPEKVYAIQWPMAVAEGRAMCDFSVTAAWKQETDL